MAKAKYYAESKRRLTGKNAYKWERLPDGRLYANGIYPSKKTKETLPESFIEVYYLRQWSFLQSAGVVDLIYRPAYWMDNHLYKDDCLLISYEKKITAKTQDEKWSRLDDYEGVDIYLFGSSMANFIDGVEKYSHLDVSAIKEELYKKKLWYVRNNPTHQELANEKIDFETKVYFLARNFRDKDYPLEQQRAAFLQYCQRYKLTPMAEPYISENNKESIIKAVQQIAKVKGESADDYFIVIYPIIKTECGCNADYSLRNAIEFALHQEKIVYDSIYIRGEINE